METLIVSLILAAISGLTFIAYKHPSGYRNIADKIRNTIMTLAIVVVSFFLGSIAASIYFLRVAVQENVDGKITSIKDSVISISDQMVNVVLIIAVVVGIYGYLYFLSKLPDILESKDDKGSL